jgi:hypothetical protein
MLLIYSPDYKYPTNLTAWRQVRQLIWIGQISCQIIIENTNLNLTIRFEKRLYNDFMDKQENNNMVLGVYVAPRSFQPLE